MIDVRPQGQTETAPATQTTPIRVKKIGHVVYSVSDVERTTRFWTENLGFHVSDRNEIGMVFLRHGADHHSIALCPGAPDAKLPAKDQTLGLNHFAMELENMEDLFKAREFLKSRGVHLVFEGRRGPGSNAGIEFHDPDGYLIELYASMEQIGWSGTSRPPKLWRRATSLEEAAANPVPVEE